MRTLLILLSLVIPLAFSAGCTERRPDPRANPDFDESALEPGAAARQLTEVNPD